MSADFVKVIEKRRDGLDHSPEEIRAVCDAAAKGSVPDYQLSAWLMACYLRPMSFDQTALLTQAMADSGERIDLTGLPEPWVDKHSTGGVGDKTTIVLLPLLASLGCTLVEMSGAGLGITGGTVDKLASAGLRMDLTPEEMVSQASRIGLALTGQTPRLAPADGALYALRDVTATVPSIPLIASSILSKKIAGGCRVVGLDVKCGSGAMMKDLTSARELAKWLLGIGRAAGLQVHALISDMGQPLGRATGNALEVREAIQVLRGYGPSRLRELCLALASQTLEAVGLGGRQDAERALDVGTALRKAEQWFEAQGSDMSCFEEDAWQAAPSTTTVCWHGSEGFAASVSAQVVGQVVVELGGGRKSKADVIDPRVGVEVLVEVGDPVAPGQPVFRIHSAEPRQDLADLLGAAALHVGTSPVSPSPVVLEVATG